MFRTGSILESYDTSDRWLISIRFFIVIFADRAFHSKGVSDSAEKSKGGFRRRISSCSQPFREQPVFYFPWQCSIERGDEQQNMCPDCLRNGGQQQRVVIARALASDTPVILGDEPTGNLDGDMAREIAGILKESAHGLDKCVIVVTHSAKLAAEADVILNLKNGSLYRKEYFD